MPRPRACRAWRTRSCAACSCRIRRARQRMLEHRSEVAAVVGQPHRGLEGHRFRRDEILFAQFDPVDTGQARGFIHQPLHEISSLPGAQRRDTHRQAWCWCGRRCPAHRSAGCRTSPAGSATCWRSGSARRRREERTDVGDHADTQGEELAGLVQRQFAVCDRSRGPRCRW